jgi:membrane protease YdiL (CAAX protease family)
MIAGVPGQGFHAAAPSPDQADDARRPGAGRPLQVWWRLSLLGIVGASSMALAPLERLVPVPIDPVLLRLLSTVQPTLLVLLAAALGLWAAPKVGLDAPVFRAWAEGRAVLPALRRQAPAAILAGLAAAAILLAFWSFVRGRPEAASLTAFEIPLVTKLLYGGIVEELLLRWGLMSLFAWIIWRIAGAPGKAPAWGLWTALAAAALLFAFGHLPVLHLLVPDPAPALTAAVLAANFMPGLVFGWLFWKRGLEAAMMAHALAHLFAATALGLGF